MEPNNGETIEIVEKEKTDTSVSNLLDVLSAIANIQRANTQVRAQFSSVGVADYGPNEWTFRVTDKLESRFEVMLIGQERNAYVIRRPLIEGNFSTLDEFLSYNLSLLDKLLERVYTLYIEPDVVNICNELVAEPSNLGFPIDQLLESNVHVETIHSSIAPFCKAIRSSNANFSSLSLFEGVNLGAIRIAALDVHRHVMRNLRALIEEMFEHVNRGVLPQKVPTELNSSTLLSGVPNPANLNLMFQHIPRRIHLATTFVGELLMPELMLESLPPSTMMSLAGQTAARVSTVNSFCNISFSPVMNDQIAVWVLSLLSPGSIQFNVNFDEISETDVYLRALVGLCAKLLLSYRGEERWNSITPRTLHAVEQAIVNAGTEAGILTGAHAQGETPLTRVIPVANSGLSRLDLLQTRADGNGWRNGPYQRYGLLPRSVPYVNCQRRQLIATNLDHARTIETGESSEAFNDWEPRIGVYDFLTTLNKGKIQRTPMTGLNAIMQTLTRRLMEFYIAFNEYTAANWYTSLRLSERDAMNMFHDDSETPLIYTLDAKTILFMMKALHRGSVGVRKSSYDIQVKAECAVMRDCIESRARNELLERLVIKYKINMDLFTTSERLRLICMQSGPLSIFFNLLRESGMLRDLGPFYSCCEGNDFSDIYDMMVETITNNPLEFGILGKLKLRSTVPLRRLPKLRELASRGLPYTNVYDINFERGGQEAGNRKNTTITLPDLERMLSSYDALESIREYSLIGSLTLSLPFPLRIVVGQFPSSEIQVIDIDYSRIDNDRNIRKICKFNGAPMTLVAIDQARLHKPDLYLKSISPYESVFIDSDDAGQILIPVSQWLGALGKEAFVSPAVRTKLLRIVPFFERT